MNDAQKCYGYCQDSYFQYEHNHSKQCIVPVYGKLRNGFHSFLTSNLNLECIVAWRFLDIVKYLVIAANPMEYF